MQSSPCPDEAERRRIFLSLAGQIESQLRDAYALKHDQQGVTQTDLARRLCVNRSAINHRLKGHVNMTVETIADMVWALDHAIKVTIYDPRSVRSNSVSASSEVSAQRAGRLPVQDRLFESAPA